MHIIPYTLLAYGLTAVISLAVILIVIIIGKIMTKTKKDEEIGNDA